ncbi:hypothetical protein chiPu_0015266 [Chiloscyllium punctatum]|uniref:Uncharacterized protein n=1 Tax=Chiloscyllium punctatum TaxID=137246 RepID=A0A401T2B4_CHIPU|nr:hypothetical protein [Chiloscyllium punctatum]
MVNPVPVIVGVYQGTVIQGHGDLSSAWGPGSAAAAASRPQLPDRSQSSKEIEMEKLNGQNRDEWDSLLANVTPSDSSQKGSF